MGVAHGLRQPGRAGAERVGVVGVERALRERLGALARRAVHEVPERDPSGRGVGVDADLRRRRAGSLDCVDDREVGDHDVGFRERERVLQLRRLPRRVRQHDGAAGQAHAVLSDDPLRAVADRERDARARHRAPSRRGRWRRSSRCCRARGRCRRPPRSATRSSRGAGRPRPAGSGAADVPGSGAAVGGTWAPRRSDLTESSSMAGGPHAGNRPARAGRPTHASSADPPVISG